MIRNESSLDKHQHEQHESDSEEKCYKNASAEHEKEEGKAERKSESIAGISLVSNDSAAMGQLESTAAETNSNTVSAHPKEEQHKATITLKVIQFIGELPKETRDNELEFMRQGERKKIDATAEINEIENGDNFLDNKSIYIDDTVTEINESGSLLHRQRDVVGDVPKLDHNKKENENIDEPKKHLSECSFDDNYRVESPKQVCIETNHQRTKRHAMLIQEISESSSSEEVKNFLNAEATALEMKIDNSEVESAAPPSSRAYRVDSPESSDDNNNIKISKYQDDVTVKEIGESSSSESVKNELLASILQTPLQKADAKIGLKIINIKELPSEDIVPSNVKQLKSALTNVSPSKINISQFECKAEKKLNKAEEAILEALYGNKNLLQIPNLPLDVISEEGSDCGSDVDKQAPNKVISDELDDDVFLPSSSPQLSKKPPSARRRSDQQRQRIVVEQPLLIINTKIVEAESNIPESCKSWETFEGDNELQAELVYLTSTSSSATDLSERGDITDSENEADTSEDTETNSLLENISVPSLDDAQIEMKYSQQQSSAFLSDFYQETSEQKLPDILEEDEDQSPRSLEIIASQRQIEDVNKELYNLVSEHEVSLTREKVETEKEEKKTQVQQLEDDGKIQEESTLKNDYDNIHDNVCDKRLSENDKDGSNRVTPTLLKRKNSSDSSSSANSQCTIIRQNATYDQSLYIGPLKDLCMQSLSKNDLTLDVISGSRSSNKDMNGEGKITIQRKLNSLYRNAPQIPIINELELHYQYHNDNFEGRENDRDRVITILQVPPEINSRSPTLSDKKRWIGLQSSQVPNLMLALSPLQKSHIMSSPDSNTTADDLLDMHKKFVERRAYHETEIHEPESAENSNSRQMNVLKVNESQLEEGYCGDRENSVENVISASAKKQKSPEINSNLCESPSSVTNCDNRGDVPQNLSAPTSSHENIEKVERAEGGMKMNSIRNYILREEFFSDNFHNENRDDESPSSKLAESFEGKKFELEAELKRLDDERRELEEDLKNLQSLQHFKREEFLFNEKKLQEKLKDEYLPFENRNSSIKYANDDFTEFINSNEKLQEELYNEWQDKVLERYERKLQKTIKITSISEAINHDDQLERAASENLRFVPLESEFMTKLKERQKRLSLPIETELNSSTESLHHQNEEIKKIDEIKHSHKTKEIPAHLYEFLKYYEDETAQSKNSDESGESNKKRSNLLMIGLIGVPICLCGFFIGKLLITQRSKLF